jgi:hypothetical protein
MSMLDHECSEPCFMCGRPYDAFRHIHLAPDHQGPLPREGEAIQGRQIVLCVPCLAEISRTLAPVCAAYARGGYAFDAYRKRTRGGRSGIPLPKWLEEAMRDIMQQQDDAD